MVRHVRLPPPRTCTPSTRVSLHAECTNLHSKSTSAGMLPLPGLCVRSRPCHAGIPWRPFGMLSCSRVRPASAVAALRLLQRGCACSTDTRCSLLAGIRCFHRVGLAILEVCQPCLMNAANLSELLPILHHLPPHLVPGLHRLCPPSRSMLALPDGGRTAPDDKGTRHAPILGNRRRGAGRANHLRWHCP